MAHWIALTRVDDQSILVNLDTACGIVPYLQGTKIMLPGDEDNFIAVHESVPTIHNIIIENGE